MLVPTPTPADYARAKEASDAVVAQLRRLVEAKHDAPGDDLVSGLIAARDGEERLDNQELLSTIFQLIVAGHDTTTTFIGNAVVALLGHPEQLELLRGDPDRIPAAVEELLRYDAPVPHSTFRYAVEPVEIGGHLDPGRRAGHRLPRRRQPRPVVASPIPSSSTWSGRKGVTSRSGTASTTAWAPRWPGSRASWRWDRSSGVSPGSASPASVPDCTGATATGSCCAACPSCRSFPAPRCPEPQHPRVRTRVKRSSRPMEASRARTEVFASRVSWRDR